MVIFLLTVNRRSARMRCLQRRRRRRSPLHQAAPLPSPVAQTAQTLRLAVTVTAPTVTVPAAAAATLQRINLLLLYCHLVYYNV